MSWFTKKEKGKIRHINTKKIRRVSEDIDPEIIASVLDTDDLVDIINDSNSTFQDGNYRPDEIEPIEDLSGKQRRMVEDFVGSPIILIHDDKTHKPSLIFDNTEEWIVYRSESEVDSDIRSRLEFQLKNFPEMFDQQWLDKFRRISMNSENRIIKSKEEADRITKYADKAELLGLAKSFGLHVSSSSSISELRDVVHDGVQAELKHQLQDPVEYYVNLEGKYTESQLAKMPWVTTHINYNDAISDAIETNGRSHFLSTVDGREVHLGDMFLYRIR